VGLDRRRERQVQSPDLVSPGEMGGESQLNVMAFNELAVGARFLANSPNYARPLDLVAAKAVAERLLRDPE
jgi:hypothetical protein